MGKHYIFTDCDLDGAGSYLVYKWIVGESNIPYQVCRVNDLKQKVKAFSKSGGFNKYEKICLFDFDVSDPELVELIDHENVLIVDHHESNIEAGVTFKKAEVIIEPAGSVCKLLYTKFKNKCEAFTSEQKLLIALVNDYDSYTLKSPLSKQLNTVFWSYQGDRVQKFCRDFPTGFTGFNKFHSNTIALNAKEWNDVKSKLDIYIGQIDTEKYSFSVASAVATKFINDVADHLCDVTTANVAIVVNPKSGKISFRRRKGDDTVSMVKLASLLTDESGGHDSAAGGLMCDKFLSFTKTLQPFIIA